MWHFPLQLLLLIGLQRASESRIQEERERKNAVVYLKKTKLHTLLHLTSTRREREREKKISNKKNICRENFLPSIFVVVAVGPAVNHRQAFTTAITTFSCLNVTRRVFPLLKKSQTIVIFFYCFTKRNQIEEHFFSYIVYLFAGKKN